MPIEESLDANTKALNNLASVLSKAGVSAATPAAGEAAKRPPGRPKSVPFDDVKAMAEKVRDTKGRPAAVALINKHGATSLTELDKGRYAEFIAAAEVLLAEEEPAAEEAAADDSL